MSAGPRIPLADADRVAAHLVERWGGHGLTVVGSVRRRRPDVGDLEMIAPAHDGRGRDELCERIQGDVGGVVGGGLFADQSRVVIGTALRGLKPGFLACSLLMRPWDIEIPLQIYRYTKENRGWLAIERTGPREFGIWFLTKWKEAFGIPIGKEDRKASIENHLVDAGGRVVPVESEEEAFFKCGIAFVPPERRDAVMEHAAKARAVR